MTEVGRSDPATGLRAAKCSLAAGEGAGKELRIMHQSSSMPEYSENTYPGLFSYAAPFISGVSCAGYCGPTDIVTISVSSLYFVGFLNLIDWDALFFG